MLTVERCSEAVFLERNLTKSFTAWKFRNKVAMTMIFFFKIFEILWKFQKWIKNIRNGFWFYR